MIPSKGPNEARARGQHSYTGGKPHDVDDGEHAQRTRHGVGGRKENLQVGVSRRGFQCGLDITNAKQQDQQHCEAKNAIDGHCGHNRPRDEHNRVMNFFSHLTNESNPCEILVVVCRDQWV